MKEWVLDTEREHKNVNRSAKTAGSIKGCLPKILKFICKFSKRALNVFPTGHYISSAMVFFIRFSTLRYIISLPQTQTEPINRIKSNEIFPKYGNAVEWEKTIPNRCQRATKRGKFSRAAWGFDVVLGSPRAKT